MLSVRETLAALKAETDRMLQPVESLSDRQLAITMHVYERLIRPYFISQIATVEVFCRSEVARAACADNFRCEVEEDHRGMLRRFTAQADGWLEDPEVAETVRQKTSPAVLRQLILPLRDLIDCSENAVSGLWVLGGLETSSQAFIPWKGGAARRLGMKDNEYLAKHGVADIAHADEFAAAIEAEAKFLGCRLETAVRIRHHSALAPTYRLLEHIFCA